MKRVLCILSSLDTGGAETFMMKLFRSMPKDYKIDFVVSAENGYYEEEVLELGGHIYRIPLRTKQPFKTFIELVKVVKTNKYKHVIKLCDTPLAFYDLLAVKIGGAKKISVRSCNASAELSNKAKMLCSIIRPFFNYLADVKIAPSSLAAEFTFGKTEVLKKNVHILNNAIDLKVYQYSKEQRKIIRRELEIKDEDFVIGHIGRFVKQKNHKKLIEIFNEISRNNPNAYLILVGVGEKQAEIIDMVNSLGLEKKVSFLGLRSDIPAILSAMDVFVLPSYYEGLPNTIIEAQATGLPCVISDSITKEARVTDLVDYVSLNDDIVKWAEKIIQYIGYERKSQDEKLIAAGFEITIIEKQFRSLVF